MTKRRIATVVFGVDWLIASITLVIFAGTKASQYHIKEPIGLWGGLFWTGLLMIAAEFGVIFALFAVGDAYDERERRTYIRFTRWFMGNFPIALLVVWVLCLLPQYIAPILLGTAFTWSTLYLPAWIYSANRPSRQDRIAMMEREAGLITTTNREKCGDRGWG